MRKMEPKRLKLKVETLRRLISTLSREQLEKAAGGETEAGVCSDLPLSCPCSD
jgi:hypothetical protein